jgi:DNA repair ATPase RecN
MIEQVQKRADTHGSWVSALTSCDAFMHMSELLKEAIEEVHVISASLREGSEELRAKASRLREYSGRLQDGSQPREER